MLCTFEIALAPSLVCEVDLRGVEFLAPRLRHLPRMVFRGSSCLGLRIGNFALCPRLTRCLLGLPPLPSDPGESHHRDDNHRPNQ